MFNWLPWQIKVLLCYAVACLLFLLRGIEFDFVNSVLIMNFVIGLIILIRLDDIERKYKK
jgi:hypothetical protein